MNKIIASRPEYVCSLSDVFTTFDAVEPRVFIDTDALFEYDTDTDIQEHIGYTRADWDYMTYLDTPKCVHQSVNEWLDEILK